MVKQFVLEEGRSLKGVVTIVTGSSSGIGRTTAQFLYNHGAHVIMACRSQEKTLAVMESIQSTHPAATGHLEFMPLTLDNFQSVCDFVDAFRAKQLPLHLLINNGGTVTPLDGRLSESCGIEIIFATNHLGHFLLTELLLPIMKETWKEKDPVWKGPLRIINVSSTGHIFVKEKISLNPEEYRKAQNKWQFYYYARSKLANILHAFELSKRLMEEGWGDKIHTYSLHPGAVKTDVYRAMPRLLFWFLQLFMITEEQGSYTTLYCSLSPECEQDSGDYYDDCVKLNAGTSKCSKFTKDEELAKELWTLSETLCKDFLNK